LFWSAEKEKFMKGKGPSLGPTFFFKKKKIKGANDYVFGKKKYI
jgi:hypothetical protein